MDKQQFQYAGLKWLQELEILAHPQLLNTIKFNILGISKHVKEVELLIHRENKSMLILLDLTWIGRKFLKHKIFSEIEDLVLQLLPSFRVRVTEDKNIMELAMAKIQKALLGGSNENTSNINFIDYNSTYIYNDPNTTTEGATFTKGYTTSSSSDSTKSSKD